jgi:hypothetical protein
MSVILKAISGPLAGRNFEVPAGGLLRFGRTARADCALPEDSFLSSLHFAMGSDQTGWFVRDLGSSNGTFLNGAKVAQAPLADGDQVRAGDSTFVVHIGDTGPAATPDPATLASIDDGEDFSGAAPLRKVLRSQREPLYAVLDAARNPKIIALLSHSRHEFRSLYEGNAAVDLALHAPYIVRLPEESPLLEKLACQAWGKSMGLYLTSRLPLEDVRHHLRHFLMAEIEGGKPVYFRFYDPRVLRVYLPTCTDAERREFFGPIEVVLLEGEPCSQVFQFSPNEQAPRRQELLAPTAGAGRTLSELS